ncbi:hypothetical protein NEMIN01_1100 [Nematocida minor]|uniref:uncharacterized protein n=1 Tax=Nematocida minor TaxID=1912983 RepID=UPI002220C75D|nr:uncharacterized protein NEMIN01_1100 [Nematocida minor]KAI5190562.1 hypothetical protein NEMIN01_1100 [Nematocida minor]
MFKKREEKKKMFVHHLAALGGLSYGKGKMAKAMCKWSREIAASALYQNKCYSELLECVGIKGFLSIHTVKYILVNIAVSLKVNQKTRALEIVNEYKDVEECPRELLRSLSVLIEGHMHFESRSLSGCKEWLVKRAYEHLKNKFDFSVFILAYRVLVEVLMESDSVAIHRLLAVADYNNLAYIKTAEDIKDIKKLEKFLSMKGLNSGILERTYIQMNPLIKKEELLKYFENNPADTETLQVVLERRVVRELEQTARDQGIMKNAVEEKQMEKEWVIPTEPSKRVKTEEERKRVKRRIKTYKIEKGSEMTGTINIKGAKVKIPNAFRKSHSDSEVDLEDLEDEVISDYFCE